MLKNVNLERFKLSMFFLICLFTTAIGRSEVTNGENSVIFSGEISNVKSSSINIRGNANNFSLLIDLKADGTFNQTFKLPESGYYTLVIERRRSLFYLEKGDQLHISAEMNTFPESIKYSGRGSVINNYLVEKFLLTKKHNLEKTEQNKLEPSFFKDKAKKNKEQKDILLTKYKGLDLGFIAKEKRYNHYAYLSSLHSYRNRHSYDSEVYKNKIPEDFLEEMDNLDIDNEIDFDNSTEYASLCLKRYKELSKQKSIESGIYFGEAFVNAIKKVKSNNIKSILIKNIIRSEIDIRNENIFKMYDLLLDVVPDRALRSYITEYVNKVKVLEEGNVSPVFSYKNYYDQDVSLDSFKGKYVFIDVWATWCRPCLEEVPYFHMLQKKYANSNIEFVSISLDKEEDWDAWKRMIKDKGLLGVHLIADKGFKSEFIETYLVKSIPRFILVNPEGNIVDATAPSPSEKGLIDLFETIGVRPKD